jgi:hypothetical protein
MHAGSSKIRARIAGGNHTSDRQWATNGTSASCLYLPQVQARFDETRKVRAGGADAITPVRGIPNFMTQST